MLSATLSDECTHLGWAMWLDHWQWWCANCGVLTRVYDLVGAVEGHIQGELWPEETSKST
jgi:hypothetical protein